MNTSSRGRIVALIVAGVLVGAGLMAMTPANAVVKTSIASVWNQIKPKADKRYVKKSDRSKIARTAGVALTAGGISSGTAGYGQATITAPSAGFLLIQGHGVIQVSAATPLIHCGLSVDGASSWPGSDAISASVTFSEVGPNSCDNIARVPVAAGSHTVDYQAHNDGSGTATLRGGSLQVTFIPFGAEGAVGSPKPVAKPGRDLNR